MTEVTSAKCTFFSAQNLTAMLRDMGSGLMIKEETEAAARRAETARVLKII